MRAAELFADLPIRPAPQSAEGADLIEIRRIVTSAKEADAHTLYVACKTAIANGRYGVDLAFARGCRAFLCGNDAYPGKGAAVWIADEPERLLGCLSAKILGYPARTMTVIGITGSTGKSSVAAQTVQVLRHAGKRVSALTSDGLDLLGDCRYPDAVVPDALYIQNALWQMARTGSEIAVLEFSSYQLAHFAAESIPFTAVLLTNLSPRHIGHAEHESFAEYCAAKISLLQAQSAFCVLPDTQCADTAARVIRMGESGDFWVENARTEILPHAYPRTRLQICTKEEKTEIIAPVVGDFAPQNLLCAFVLCRIVGLESTQIAQGLSLPLTVGRMECLSIRCARTVFLDAAFLPQDLERALQTLRPLATGRLCVLLGSVGGRAKERRAALARVAECGADHLYLIADDPDFEDPSKICAEMRDAMSEPMRATVLPDRRAAILRAIREMRPDDLLLVLAKPYPAGQLVRGKLLPFDERAVIKDTLAEF